MYRLTTTGIRHWVALGMLLILLASVAIWLLRPDRLPWTVRLATGEQGGLYSLVGSELGESLEDRVNRRVSIEPTAGSQENFQRLVDGHVQLAIVQGGSVPIEDVAVVTPLFPEILMVIVRKGSGIEKVSDLAGKNIALGKRGSGNRHSALAVLRHFGIKPEELGKNDLYFKSLVNDRSLDGALVTAGVAHPDLKQVLSTNDFEILPINSAPAIDMVHPFLLRAEIPQGLFAERPSVPATSIPTIATTAFLVARADAHDGLVRAALATVHEESLRLRVPTLIPRQDVPEWTSTRMHPVAQRYFNPSDNIGMMANVMESLAATKELLFAIGAGIFLLWHRWRRLKERESEELISRQKEHLDHFLEKTLHIEAAQMTSDNPEELRTYLDEVTQIKLDALHEFTEEELRGDQAFSIFLAQCANLMNNLQLKIVTASSSES